MRRSVVCFAAAFGLGIGLRHLGDSEAVLAWGLAVFLTGAALCWKAKQEGSKKDREKHWSCLAAILMFFLLGAAWLTLWDERESGLLALAGEDLTVFGIVTAWEERGAVSRIVIEEGVIQAVNHNVSLKKGQKLLVMIKGGWNEGEDSLGCRVSLQGRASLPSGARNPGGFDYKLYLKTQGISLLVEAEEASVVSDGQKQGWRHWLHSRKQTFARRAEGNLGSVNAGLISAMLFGDKSMLDEDVRKGFQRNGGAHILAVSGIHASIVHGFIGKLLRGRKGVLPSALTGSALLVYAALADFSPSVVRAVLMIGLAVSARLLHRRYDMLTACGLAFMCQLAVNPYTLFHSGFQMSYLAVAVICVALPWTEYRIEKLLLKVPEKHWKEQWLKRALPLVVIQGALMPAGAYTFNFVTLTSFLFNPPALLLGGMALPVGLTLFLLWNLPAAAESLLAGFLSAFLTVLISAMVYLNNWLSGLSGMVFQTVSPPKGLVLLFYSILFMLTCESWHMLKRRGKRLQQAGMTAVVLAVACVLPWSVGLADAPHFLSRTNHAMVFVDVGQGDCLHVRTPSGKNILIDGGGSAFRNVGEETLLPYLLKNGVAKLDAAVVTHMHTDHFKGIAELAEHLEVKQLVLYEGYEQEETHKTIPAGAVRYTKSGDRIQLDKDVWVEVLYPERRTPEAYAAMSEADENFMSLVMRVNYKGITTLATADVGFPGEAELVRLTGEQLQCHILQAGHHGSKYSTSAPFLEAVNPRAAIVQVGKNNFGHPNPQVIELFSQYGIMVGRNDTDGAVTVRIRRDGTAVIASALGEYKWLIK